MHILAAFIPFLPFSLSNSIQPRDNGYIATCHKIANKISSASTVYYPGSTNFVDDIEHWFPSSSQESQCSVEPGTVEDVSIIIKILSGSTTPFAIRSGGHATAVGFSSTLGVQISLVRLNSVAYDSASGIATIGAGLTWDQVYQKLEPFGVNVAGGRTFGVGVGGYALGGGYSWLSNRHGLMIDNVVEYELVQPGGNVVTVTASSAPDLFFGLRGGFSNFGLVTKLKMHAYPQGLIWGGLIDYTGDNIAKANAAVAKFAATNTNPDGNVLISVGWANGVPTGSLAAFYNGPTPPPDLFADFLAIPFSSNGAKTTNFYDFIVATSANYLNTERLRGTWSSVSMPHITVPVLAEAVKQGEYWGKPGVFSSAPSVAFVAEPFISASIVRPINVAAYPHDVFVNPLLLHVAWPNITDDAAGFAAIKAFTANMTQALIDDKQDLTGTVLYPNYALGDTKIEALYGANLPKLKTLRTQYDPTGVFLRTGGFKFV